MRDKMWDIVVLTAMDEQQKLAFELQLKEILQRDEFISQSAKIFRVFADKPSGVRIGSGGATLLALKRLHDEFGESLYSKKILLLHAGGLSQRQPNGSALGKIFQLLPTKLNRPLTAFELKLQIYSKFLPLFESGIFLGPADTLEYFDDDSTTFKEENSKNVNGFTLIGHPSSLAVGVNHGVYVLDEKTVRNGQVFASPVRKVLQKPTLDEMYRWRAVDIDQQTKNEFIYSDSFYFFTSDVVERLLSYFHRRKCILDVEIDAYGDFLQPLGIESTSEYVETNQQLSSVRRELYDLLTDVDVRALIFRRSKFYHLGTFKELIDFYCDDKTFRNEFEFSKRCFVSLIDEKQNFTSSIDGCVICSRLKFDSIIGDRCLVEICDFPNGVEMRNSSILSNCRSTKRHRLPPNVFLTTLAVDDDVVGVAFVTIFFAVDENLKKSCEKLEEFSFLNRRFVDVMKILRLNDRIFDDDRPKSLWYAKIFRRFTTMEASFDDAVERIRLIDDDGRSPAFHDDRRLPVIDDDDGKLFSMHDCLTSKNVEEILKRRKILFDDIRKGF